MDTMSYMPPDGRPVSLPRPPWIAKGAAPELSADARIRRVGRATYIAALKKIGGWVSNDDIASEVGVCKETARKVLKRLSHDGQAWRCNTVTGVTLSHYRDEGPRPLEPDGVEIRAKKIKAIMRRDRRRWYLLIDVAAATGIATYLARPAMNLLVEDGTVERAQWVKGTPMQWRIRLGGARH